MDRQAILAAFDEQIRRHPAPDGHVEYEEGVIRSMSARGGWTGVTWCDLDHVNADAVIAAQINRFVELSRPWEWKHYSYDQPPDLPDRLLVAGFTPQPAEALLVAEIAGLALDVPPPPGVELLTGLARQSSTTVAVLALAGCTPIAAGRVDFHPGTDFASLWGGGTVPAWRGRGVFRSLVAHRAALASARGFRYLQVDASPDSRPIFQRLGFVELATTTPFIHPGGAS
ncbi:MAG: GNAT family N-acetyltransferase [Pseudonocardiaceae bacterium]